MEEVPDVHLESASDPDKVILAVTGVGEYAGMVDESED